MRTSFTLYRALLDIDVPEDKAREVVDALEADMRDTLVTKADLKGEMKELELRLTLRLGAMMLGTAGLVVAILRLLPAA